MMTPKQGQLLAINVAKAGANLKGRARYNAMVSKIREQMPAFNGDDLDDWNSVLGVFPGRYGTAGYTEAHDVQNAIDELPAILDVIRQVSPHTAGTQLFSAGSTIEAAAPTEDGAVLHGLARVEVDADFVGISTATIDLKDIEAYEHAVLYINTDEGKVTELTELTLGVAGLERKLHTGIGGFIDSLALSIAEENDGPSRIPRGIYLPFLSNDDRQLVVKVRVKASSVDWAWKISIVGVPARDRSAWPTTHIRAQHVPRLMGARRG